MGRVLCGAVIALGLASCQTLPPQAQVAAPSPASAYSGPLMKRTALVVSDMERALSLYAGVLGFQSNGVTQSAPTSYSYEVFNLPRDKPLRFVTLNAGPAQVRALALAEIPGIRHDQNGARESGMVINANGRLDAILDGVRSLGLSIIPERTLNSVDGRVGREVAFTDWDGHLIVLYDFPGQPGQGDPR